MVKKNKHKGNSQRSTLVTNRIFPYLSYKDWFPLVSCSCTVKQTKGGKELNMAKMHHCSTNSFYRITEVTNKEGSFASKQTITKLWHTIISISKNYGAKRQYSGVPLQANNYRTMRVQHSLFVSSFSLATARRLSLAACANVDGLPHTFRQISEMETLQLQIILWLEEKFWIKKRSAMKISRVRVTAKEG